MCKSVRGAAYFGASVHTIAAIFFLLWFLFDTVVVELNLNLWKCEEDEPRKSFSSVPQYLNLLFKFIYYTCLSITGIYMFRGVERAAPRVIKFSLLTFVVLQTVSLFIFIMFVLFAWKDEPAPGRFEPVPTAASQFILQVDNMTYTTTTEGRYSDENLQILPEKPAIAMDEVSTESGPVGVIDIIMPTIPPVIEDPIEVPPVISIPTIPPPVIKKPTDPPVRKIPEQEKEFEIGIKSRLTEGQLVSFVFEILGVVFNAVGSVIYTGILITYMVGL